MAIGFGAAPFTGGATLPIALSGLTEMTGPGGVMGPSLTPTLPSIKAPAPSLAPGADVASTPTTAASTGLVPNAPAPGSVSGGSSAPSGPSSEVINQAVQQAMMKFGGPAAASNPFAQYSDSGFSMAA